MIVIMAVLLMAGCKVSKEASVVSEVKTETKADVSEVVASESKVHTAVDRSADWSETEVMDEYVSVYAYSAPDSAGKQYVVTATYIERTKATLNKGTQKEAVRQVVDKQELQSKSDKSVTKTDEKTRTQEKAMTNTKTPGWLYVAVGLVVVGLLVVGYLILKRNKII